MANPTALVAVESASLRNGIINEAGSALEVAGVVTRPDELALDRTVDLILVDAPMLRGVARRIRRRAASVSAPHPPIVLLLAGREFRDALGLLALCRGVIYWAYDRTATAMALHAALALEGYSAVPAAVIPDLLSDRVRVELVTGLSATERATLDLLGTALTNRAIAQRLGVPEPHAKSLVRAVLTKLRLKNRTEAAVFAARWRRARPAPPSDVPLTSA